MNPLRQPPQDEKCPDGNDSAKLMSRGSEIKEARLRFSRPVNQVIFQFTSINFQLSIVLTLWLFFRRKRTATSWFQKEEPTAFAMNGQSKIRPSEVSEPLVTSTIADFPELPVHPHTFLKAKAS